MPRQTEALYDNRLDLAQETLIVIGMRMTAGQQHRANIASRNHAMNTNDCWGNPKPRNLDSETIALARRYEGESRYADAAKLYRAINNYYDADRCETNHRACLQMAIEQKEQQQTQDMAAKSAIARKPKLEESTKK